MSKRRPDTRMVRVLVCVGKMPFSLLILDALIWYRRLHTMRMHV